MIPGLLFSLAAGLMWGLVFVAPLWLADYPPAVLTVGRYAAFGVIALAIALTDRVALARLPARDWVQAARLSLMGNFLYYVLLASAIQTAGAPVPTMIIGTLPVAIAVVANAAERALPWARLSVSLAALLGGVGLVNLAELQGPGERDAGTLAVGALLALAGVACWTWYAVMNARALARHPGLAAGTWATAQGLMTLPLALAGGLGLWLWDVLGPGLGGTVGAHSPLGPDPVRFVATMALLGLFASWLGTLCWNAASRRLPTSLAGQLIVFETLAALAYGYLHRGEWPAPAAWAGIALLVIGVVLGVRAFAARRVSAPA